MLRLFEPGNQAGLGWPNIAIEHAPLIVNMKIHPQDGPISIPYMFLFAQMYHLYRGSWKPKTTSKAKDVKEWQKVILQWNCLYVRSTPHPVTVTTRIITFLVGNPYKPSFATVTGWGVDPTYTIIDSVTLDLKHDDARLYLLFTYQRTMSCGHA